MHSSSLRESLGRNHYGPYRCRNRAYAPHHRRLGRSLPFFTRRPQSSLLPGGAADGLAQHASSIARSSKTRPRCCSHDSGCHVGEGPRRYCFARMLSNQLQHSNGKFPYVYAHSVHHALLLMTTRTSDHTDPRYRQCRRHGTGPFAPSHSLRCHRSHFGRCKVKQSGAGAAAAASQSASSRATAAVASSERQTPDPTHSKNETAMTASLQSGWQGETSQSLTQSGQDLRPDWKLERGGRGWGGAPEACIWRHMHAPLLQESLPIPSTGGPPSWLWLALHKPTQAAACRPPAY